MSRGLNKVMIIGNLGNDPELRYLPNGDAVANLSIATSEAWTDRHTGEKHEKTEWHRVVAFRRLAEIIRDYLQKGSKVYIEGKLQTRKWQDNQGIDRYSTEILANDMQMLDSRSDGGGYDSRPAPRQHAGNSQQRPPVRAHSAPVNPPMRDDFDDDIPF